jgi:arginyl-tRNA synthetase
MSAVFIQDMSANRMKDYDYNPKRMFQFEGYTGPYLQFSHARICGIEEKSGVKINPDANISLLLDSSVSDEKQIEAALHLAVVIAKYPSILQAAAQVSDIYCLHNYH